MFPTYDAFIQWWLAVPWHELPRWMILTLFLLMVYLLFPQQWLPRKRKMGRGHGWQTKFADLITEAIDTGFHTGKLTKKEAARAYRKCADAFGLDDLRPKSPLYLKAGLDKVEWVKRCIRKRINGGADKVTPLPIPDLGPVVYQAPPGRVKKKLKIT